MLIYQTVDKLMLPSNKYTHTCTCIKYYNASQKVTVPTVHLYSLVSVEPQQYFWNL